MAEHHVEVAFFPKNRPSLRRIAAVGRSIEQLFLVHCYTNIVRSITCLFVLRKRLSFWYNVVRYDRLSFTSCSRHRRARAFRARLGETATNKQPH